jgi:hypothetical protein
MCSTALLQHEHWTLALQQLQKLMTEAHHRSSSQKLMTEADDNDCWVSVMRPQFVALK